MIYILGVGGIGMSAIAESLHLSGKKVYGSDMQESYITKRLESLGIEIKIGHNISNLDKASLVIRSSAIKNDNIEIVEAIKKGIKIIHRSEALTEFLDGYRVISITGTHGKSTTTSMLGSILMETNDFDPTIINGAFMNAFGSNVRIGNKKIAVIESDESDGSHLILPSNIGCITNINSDHLDYYGTVSAIKASYYSFIEKTLEFCVCCFDHPSVKVLAQPFFNTKIISYGITGEYDVFARNIKIKRDGTSFDLYFSDSFQKRIGLKISNYCDFKISNYGNHNVQNALASIAISLMLGIPLEKINNALAKFQGTKRRFTLTGEVNGIAIIDDYAHHPFEIQATLKSAKDILKDSNNKIFAIVQPHRYTRLAQLMDEFSKSFLNADFVILTNVYSANEKPIENINSKVLAELANKIKPNIVGIFNNYEEIAKKISQLAKFGDMVILLGAGDITNLSYKLPELLLKEYS